MLYDWLVHHDSMLFNLLYLLILPNFKPDNLLNINIGFNFNTMLVLYYSHHLFTHVLIYC